MKKQQTDPAIMIALLIGGAAFAWLSHHPQAWPHPAIAFLAKLSGQSLTLTQSTMIGTGMAAALGLVPGTMFSSWENRLRTRLAARKSVREAQAQERERALLARKQTAATDSAAMVKRFSSRDQAANQFHSQDLLWMLPALALIGTVFWYVL